MIMRTFSMIRKSKTEKQVRSTYTPPPPPPPYIEETLI